MQYIAGTANFLRHPLETIQTAHHHALERPGCVGRFTKQATAIANTIVKSIPLLGRAVINPQCWPESKVICSVATVTTFAYVQSAISNAVCDLIIPQPFIDEEEESISTKQVLKIFILNGLALLVIDRSSKLLAQKRTIRSNKQYFLIGAFNAGVSTCLISIIPSRIRNRLPILPTLCNMMPMISAPSLHPPIYHNWSGSGFILITGSLATTLLLRASQKIKIIYFFSTFLRLEKADRQAPIPQEQGNSKFWIPVFAGLSTVAHFKQNPGHPALIAFATASSAQMARLILTKGIPRIREIYENQRVLLYPR